MCKTKGLPIYLKGDLLCYQFKKVSLDKKGKLYHIYELVKIPILWVPYVLIRKDPPKKSPLLPLDLSKKGGEKH